MKKQQRKRATVTKAPAVKAPKPVVEAPPTFTLTGETFSPGRGLATELHKALAALGSATAQQLADALLASGVYQKVAPQAAKLRPVKPVETLLGQWLAKGIVKA